LRESYRSMGNQLKIDESQIEQAKELLSIKGQESEITRQRLNKYYEWIGGEVILSSNYVDLSLLMNLYLKTGGSI